MTHIIHDWNDSSATRVLQACHRALGPKSKLLIVDTVVPPGNTPHYGKLLDLEMLELTPRGREQTKPNSRRCVARDSSCRGCPDTEPLVDRGGGKSVNAPRP
jgi:hypothetical protein